MATMMVIVEGWCKDSDGNVYGWNRDRGEWELTPYYEIPVADFNWSNQKYSTPNSNDE